MSPIHRVKLPWHLIEYSQFGVNFDLFCSPNSLKMLNATLAFCILALTKVCERVCLFQWHSFQCSGVVVLCVGFHDFYLASVDV